MEKQRLSMKVFHLCIIFIIIFSIFFVAIMFILNYNEKGESNMPFNISKISIISTVDGQNNDSLDFRWNINTTVNNDIYIYIEKNNSFKKTETISNITLSNFSFMQEPKIGNLKIYKPNEQNNNIIFQNSAENETTNLNFTGEKETNLKNMHISNQGGIIGFRCSNNDLGKYQSNDDTEINYNELLKKINVNEESLKNILSFDIILQVDSGKSYKAENIKIEIPNSSIVEKGTVGKEILDLESIVFKRMEL